MKQLTIYITLALVIILTGCKKVIDLYPESYLTTGTFYTNLAEVRTGITACYNGLQAPMLTEWMMTELRSDNSRQGVTGSSSASNRELNELDMFYLNSNHPQVYNYWQTSYYNIRNTNIVLEKLGVIYDPVTGTTTFVNAGIPIPDAERKQLAGEALIIRAHHYFNLVRLFGGVFLVHKSISPEEARLINRSSVAEVYKMIQADLQLAANSMNTLKYNQIAATAPADLGRVTGWTAKALLGKVYLTLNKKADAITVLTDVRNNSGYGLQPTFNNVFTSEVNSEILFAVRYKAGGLGLGSPFANRFGPLNTGSAVVVGDGQGLNNPTADLDSTIRSTDGRKAITIARFGTGAAIKSYTRKYIILTVANDGESDWPILRFSDVLLMLAEAQGNTPASIGLINQVRTRGGAGTIDPAGITTTKLFEDTLANERRIEFAFENHRWFDIVRYGTTMSTLNAVDIMRAHFEKEYPVHYKDYPAPALTLAQLQQQVTNEKLLLPIPQREIDTNTTLPIQQNAGY